MYCCGFTACRNCVTTKMIKSPEGVERNLAKKGEFECTKCHSNSYLPHTDEATEIKVN
jgi:hypothetical protein